MRFSLGPKSVFLLLAHGCRRMESFSYGFAVLLIGGSTGYRDKTLFLTAASPPLPSPLPLSAVSCARTSATYCSSLALAYWQP